MCWLSLLILEPVCVVGSLQSKTVLVKVISWLVEDWYQYNISRPLTLQLLTSDTHGCFFSKYVSGVRPILAGLVLNCLPLKPSRSAAFAENFSGALDKRKNQTCSGTLRRYRTYLCSVNADMAPKLTLWFRLRYMMTWRTRPYRLPTGQLRPAYCCS